MDPDTLNLIGASLRAPTLTPIMVTATAAVAAALFAIEDPRIAVPVAAAGGGALVFLAIYRPGPRERIARRWPRDR